MFVKEQNISTLCDALRSKRAEMNIPYQEISKQLKIKEHYLEAIEQGMVDKLPSKTYFIFYAKAYSDYLQLHEFEELWANLKPSNENLKLNSQQITSDHYLLPSNITLFISSILSIMIFLIAYLIF